MNKKRIIAILAFSTVLAVAGALAGCGRSDTAESGGTVTLTNVSYDPTRELYPVSYIKNIMNYSRNIIKKRQARISASSSPMADRAVRPGRSLRAARPMW